MNLYDILLIDSVGDERLPGQLEVYNPQDYTPELRVIEEYLGVFSNYLQLLEEYHPGKDSPNVVCIAWADAFVGYPSETTGHLLVTYKASVLQGWTDMFHSDLEQLLGSIDRQYQADTEYYSAEMAGIDPDDLTPKLGLLGFRLLACYGARIRNDVYSYFFEPAVRKLYDRLVRLRELRSSLPHNTTAL